MQEFSGSVVQWTKAATKKEKKAEGEVSDIWTEAMEKIMEIGSI